jgi:hypothetical protein
MGISETIAAGAEIFQRRTAALWGARDVVIATIPITNKP